MPYIYARMKVMQGSLLSNSELKSMTEYTSIIEFTDYLLESPQADSVKNATSNKKGLYALEEGISLYVYSLINKLLNLIEQNLPEFSQFFEGKFEIHNLKAKLRHFKSDSSLDDIKL